MDLAQKARTVMGVAAAIPSERDLKEVLEAASTAAERGYFTPDEDEIVRGCFSDYLSARAALHEMLGELQPLFVTTSGVRVADDQESKQAYVIAFLASAILMRAGTFMVDEVAHHKVIWQKLDEAEPRYGIPRKQFTQVYKALTTPERVWTFHWAQQRFDELRAELDFPDSPEWYGEVLQLADWEREWHQQRFRRRDYLKRRLRYRLHSWVRRNRSSWDQVLFSMMELGGTTLSRMHNPFHEKRVKPEMVVKLAGMLKPGDVLVTRHDDAMTNLFLPGFWPHAALVIGDREQRDGLSVDSSGVPPTDAEGNAIRTLESKKDGVRFRALEETLRVDAFVVIRPQISSEALKTALERSMSHEGKLYDFNFDFTKSDRMVCTEVVYRGFHQAGVLDFNLTERTGRLNFSAEDLLDLALDNGGFELVAIAGVSSDELLVGEAAERDLVSSYRSN